MGKEEKYQENGSVEAMEVGEELYAEDENKERGNWTGKADFLLSAIGFAVGLGNVWRFPYRCYENGGASFLIPYIIMLLTAGLPLFFLEMAFGQFSSQGPITVWNAMPFFRGIGYAMVIVSTLVCIYYNMIIAYTFYYIFASFTAVLPWQDCRDDWPAEWGCRPREALSNRTLWNETVDWCTEMKGQNQTGDKDFITNCSMVFNPKSPSQVYWERVVLEASDGIDEGGSEFRWPLVLCLLLAWILIFCCLSKGIKSSGKVVYVTATFPYVVLIILCIRNVTLEGAYLGIEFYIFPDWNRLKDPQVWYAAAVQIFYSLGVAFGGLQTMASYNRFKNNVFRDSLVVAVLNCATSIFAGFVIFSVLGFMAFKTGQDVKDVAESGPGLAFIAYPEGIAMMPVGPLWSILFFMMLLTLGLDSQFAMMETVLSAFSDMFPRLRKGPSKIAFTAVLCVLLFIAGLPQCTKAGIYVMNLFDYYSAGYTLVVLSLFELIALGWIYPFKKLILDFEMMLGTKHPAFWIYWVATWLVITPLMLLFIIVFMAVNYTPVTYNSINYPGWADAVGWGMFVLAIICLPVVAFIEYCKSHGFFDTMRKVFQPTDDWGPAVDEFRTGRYAPEQHVNGYTPETYDNSGYLTEKF